MGIVQSTMQCMRQKQKYRVSMVYCLRELVLCKCSHDLLNTNRNRDDAAPRGSLLRLLTSQLRPGQLPQMGTTTLAPGALRLTND